ncbi:MAG: DUF86 domain-containing protein [Ignavibacteriae bacterium]|nr:DUF86 domain-containing protein [Ignavibacteriota bacterium]
MPDKNVVLAKIGNIQRCLRRIRDITNLEPDRLENFDIQDVFVLNLQRAIQSTIDLAAHIIASEGLGLPANMKEHFSILRQSGIIPESLSRRMTAMVGFRNVAIHDYQSIDPEILKSILVTNLPDLEEFYSVILARYNLPPTP